MGHGLHNGRNLAQRILLTLVVVMCGMRAVAQIPEEEYHVSKYFTDEFRPMIEADSSIFYRHIPQGIDTFVRAADYDLSFVAFARRGVGYRERGVTLDGVPLRSGTHSLLLRLGLVRRESASVPTSESLVDCDRGGVLRLGANFSEPYSSRSVGVNLSSRGYNGGVRVVVNEMLGRGWSLAATLSARTGRDLHIDGIYTNGVDAGFSLAKRWRQKHKFALTALFAPSERGLRSSSTQEAFRLTGNNFYNPSWGLQSGKMRNANVRRVMLPAVVASYDIRLDARTELAVSLGAEVGRRGYSALTWFDAQTPMPDNYRYMPSYYASTDVAGDVEQVWRDCDPRYTQIDWDSLYEINRLNGNHAVYAVEERVERVTNLHLRASGRTRVGEKVRVRYGLAYSLERSRNYKQMADLLGSDYIVDVDYFLVDDRTYGNMLQNDLRHPDRRIVEGERYGYDYAIVRSSATFEGGIEWHSDRLRFDCGVAVGDTRIYRRGYYEKELFAKAGSLGRSRTVGFTPYIVRAAFDYAVTPKQNIALAAAVRSEAPDGENLFLQSRYNNRTTDSVSAATEMSAELGYRLRTRVLELDATLFAALSGGGVRVAHYYDDLASEYSDMVVSDISQLRVGAEVIASVRFARHWTASVATVAGYYGYAKDARVSLYSDKDNTLLCDRAVAHMGGVRTGNAPQVVLSADVAYMNRGWGARLTANYAALRYVEAEPMRRTDRVSRQGSLSEEMFRRFTEQERLPDAVSVDVAAWKSFTLGRGRKSKIPRDITRRDNAHRLVVSLSVRNLLGNSNMVYSARESLRIHRKSIADGYLYEPFPTRYTYAWPRTYYLSVTYKF